MKKIMFYIALTLMTCSISVAQEMDMMLYNRDINGIEIGDTLKYDQVVLQFGEPSNYYEYDSGDLGVDKRYIYGENSFHFNDDVFIGFSIHDSTFAALTNHIEGGLKVGDKLSCLDNFKYGKPEYHRGKSYSLFTGADNPVYLNVENGIITCIYYSTPM